MVLPLVFVLSLHAQPLERFSYTQAHMGTAFNIVLYAPDSLVARRASDAAFARIDTLNRHLSDYLSDSELSLLSATAGTGQAVPVGDDLWAVLRHAQELAAQTDGAFDVTVGPLTRLWRWATRRNQLPPEDRLAEARQQVGYRHIRLDAARQTVQLNQSGMRLDLGGIAKGYAVDEAFKVVHTFGLTRMLVDGGGDLRAGEPPPEKSGWCISFNTVDADGERATETREVAQTAIATSGATYRYLEVDGVRYSHILDPRTGMGLTIERLVTVAAPTAMEADALASAFSVLGPEQGLALVAEKRDIALRFTQRDGVRYRSYQTETFDEWTSTRE